MSSKYFSVATNLPPGSVEIKMAITLDVVELYKLIESRTSSNEGRQAFVHGVLNDLRYQLEKSGDGQLNVMVFNLGQQYKQNLCGVKFYKNFPYDNTTYGVWVFQSGTFENLGRGTFENWGFSGRFKRSGQNVTGGDGGRFVTFYS